MPVRKDKCRKVYRTQTTRQIRKSMAGAGANRKVRTTVTADLRSRVLAMAADGAMRKVIAEKCGISQSVVYSITSDYQPVVRQPRKRRPQVRDDAAEFALRVYQTCGYRPFLPADFLVGCGWGSPSGVWHDVRLRLFVAEEHAAPGWFRILPGAVRHLKKTSHIWEGVR